MFSNLISQLKEQSALDKLDAVLEEVPKVRKELGYPPLVTPTSQLVGTQAVFNILSGERYKLVSNEVRDYTKGYYGRPPVPIDKKVKRKLIGNEKPIQCRPADLLQPEFNKIPQEVQPYIESEEDKLTYALFPQVASEFFKKRQTKRRKPTATQTPEQQKLEEVAALATALTVFLKSTTGIKALIPKRNTRSSKITPWVLATRQELIR
jgi:pyruvate/oxaloacetate carboxyltransferase